MSALPPPTAWAALATAIDARPIPAAEKDANQHRREVALKALGHLLIGDSKWIRGCLLKGKSQCNDEE